MFYMKYIIPSKDIDRILQIVPITGSWLNIFLAYEDLIKRMGLPTCANIINVNSLLVARDNIRELSILDGNFFLFT